MSARIVDACCLINLYASGKPMEIVGALGTEFFVPERVRSEALTIHKPDEEDAAGFVAEPIDLTEALQAGAIRQCRVDGPKENEAFVRYARELDDGEAACLAIAKRRGWTVATDDRKAIRVATAQRIAVVTTPELVHKWVETAKPEESKVCEVLRNIESFARFRPGKSAKLYPWWTRVVGR
ncbi:MAG: hypothetical protein HQ581_27275 [Planctomycetes bacterium]|nr:hypothetical protein [Planctomycetota bacterium]